MGQMGFNENRESPGKGARIETSSSDDLFRSVVPIAVAATSNLDVVLSKLPHERESSATLSPSPNC